MKCIYLVTLSDKFKMRGDKYNFSTVAVLADTLGKLNARNTFHFNVKQKDIISLYRVSTTRQVDVVKDDIPMQRIACHDFADRFPDWEIIQEFEEEGSGR